MNRTYKADNKINNRKTKEQKTKLNFKQQLPHQKKRNKPGQIACILNMSILSTHTQKKKKTKPIDLKVLKYLHLLKLDESPNIILYEYF